MLTQRLTSSSHRGGSSGHQKAKVVASQCAGETEVTVTIVVGVEFTVSTGGEAAEAGVEPESGGSC